MLNVINTVQLINRVEVEFLNLWLAEHQELKDRHPYNELLPVVESAIADGVLTSEEKQDILWLCERLRSTGFFDETTADIQRLHAILGGIAADGAITEAELKGLSEWLSDHEHLRTCWPYEEVGSLITGVLSDKKIDSTEQKLLKEFFTEFTSILDSRTITSPKLSIAGNVVGLCEQSAPRYLSLTAAFVLPAPRTNTRGLSSRNSSSNSVVRWLIPFLQDSTT